MSLQIKLIIAAILAAAVGYSYLWTYNQGKSNCKSAVLQAQIEALSKELADQEKHFRDQRQREMREAAEVEKQLRDNENKYTNGLEALRKKYEDLRKAGVPTCTISRDTIRVLNDSGGDTGSKASS